MLHVATKIGVHHRLFCGDNFNSNNFKKLSLFNIRHDYSLQLRTLLKTPSQMISWWCFKIAAPKSFNCQKNVCSGVPSIFLKLQPYSPQFLISANTDSKKNVSFKYSEIAESLPEKSL